MGYTNFDWHELTKKGTEPFTQFLRSIEGEYLREFGLYAEERSKLSKEGVVKQWQKGVIRTNCVDCLDRTNVAKMMIASRVLKMFVAPEETEENAEQQREL